jgi:hypothetical protein
VPNYRFVMRNGGSDRLEAEEVGIFNDEGAIQYARRISHNRIVEVWNGSRLVGSVEPKSRASAPIPAETIA